MQPGKSKGNHTLLKRIREIHARSQENYGAVKTWRELVSAGEICGRNRVARLRQAGGLINTDIQRLTINRMQNLQKKKRTECPAIDFCS